MKKHFHPNLLSLAALLLLLASAIPSFAQEDDAPSGEPTAPESFLPTLPKNDNGYYVIETADDYETFRQIVATGNPYANAILTDNITVSNPIGGGAEHFHYRGTFDGQGHTVTLDMDNTDDDAMTVGLFHFTKPGCVIRNLHVSGKVYANDSRPHTGTIIADATGTIIENCISDAKIYGESKRGGLVGIARGKCMLENCAFVGEMPGGTARSGLVGENSQSLSIKSCYASPKFTSYMPGDVLPNLFTNRMESYEEKVTGETEVVYQTSLNNYFNYNYQWATTFEHINRDPAYANKVTDDDVSSGKLCYMLNVNGKKGVVWYQKDGLPYPFPVEGGQLVHSPFDDIIVQGGECNHHYMVNNHCSHCGYISGTVEPLQRRLGYCIDDVRYSYDDDNMTATVAGLLSDVKAVHIPETITYMDNMANIKTYRVTEIASRAFANTQIEYCYIPKTVKTIQSQAFLGCSGLQYVHIADGDLSENQEDLWLGKNVIEGTSLEKMYIGRDLQWDDDDMEGPFNKNINLYDIFFGPSVTRVGNQVVDASRSSLFVGDINIKKVFFLGNDKSLDTNVEVCCYSTMSNCKDFYINRNVTGNCLTTENSGGGLFDGCETAVFGPFVKTIAANSFKGIANPKPLKAVNLSHAFNLETIGSSAFYLCKSLKDITIPSSVSTIGSQAFASCEKLSRITFEDSDKELELNDNQFNGCNIGVIYLDRTISGNSNSLHPKSSCAWIIGPKVKKLYKAHFAQGNFDEVTILGSETQTPLLFDDYFDCGVITLSVDRILKCEQDGKEVIPFARKADIKFLNFGEHISHISANMFEGCTNIGFVMIPSNVAEIGFEAFKGCGMQLVCIMGDAEVGKSAFANCTNLQYLYFMGQSATLDESAFSGNNNLKEVTVLFQKDPEVESSPNAFDGKAYDDVHLVSTESVNFTSDPWRKFQKLGSAYPTSVYTGDIEQNPRGNYDRATLSHVFPTGRFDLIQMPFNMDSYYFGLDAEIYRLSRSYGDRYEDAFTLGAEAMTYDVADVALTRVDMENEKTLEPGNFYLVKVNHEEKSMEAYGSFFDNDGVKVVHDDLVLKGLNSEANIYGGHAEKILDRISGYYVFDEGVIKLYNGGKNMFQQGGALIQSVAGNGKQMVFNMKEGESLLMSSKIDIPFNALLEGYASFYAADYNYIAPEWCNVYIVTSAEEGKSVTLEEIWNRTIPKGQAVLLKSNNEGKLADNLVEHLTYATFCNDFAYTGNLLKGVDEDTPANQLSDEGFVYVLSCNSNYQNAGFYKLSGDRVMPAGKAYLDPSGLSSQALAKACLFTLKDTVSGIKSRSESRSESDAIYDLMGRRLKEAGFKGIYIVNGKKVVIK